MDLLEKILLLAVLKKEDKESIKDVMQTLVNSGAMSMKEAKAALKVLKESDFLDENDSLTFSGVTRAKEVEAEFRI